MRGDVTMEAEATVMQGPQAKAGERSLEAGKDKEMDLPYGWTGVGQQTCQFL